MVLLGSNSSQGYGADNRPAVKVVVITTIAMGSLKAFDISPER